MRIFRLHSCWYLGIFCIMIMSNMVKIEHYQLQNIRRMVDQLQPYQSQLFDSTVLFFSSSQNDLLRDRSPENCPCFRSHILDSNKAGYRPQGPQTPLNLLGPTRNFSQKNGPLCSPFVRMDQSNCLKLSPAVSFLLLLPASQSA